MSNIHSEKDRLEVAEVLAQKVIEFSNHCKHQEFASDELKCEHLAQLADIARQVTSDTNDVGEGC